MIYMNIYDDMIKFSYKNNTGLINLSGGFFVLIIKKMFKEMDNSILIVTPNMFEARLLFNKFCDNDVVLFEDDEVVLSDGRAVSPELMVDRVNILRELTSNRKRIVLTDVRGYCRRLLSVSDFNERRIAFEKDADIALDSVVEALSNFGYERVSMVEKMGDYAVRGFVLDIFPVNSDNPIRIEYFGDSIESIRYFDIDSQKSINSINDIVVYPFNEVSNGKSSLIDYLIDPITVFKDYNQMSFSYNKLASDSVELKYNFDDYYFNLSQINSKNKLYYFDFDSITSNFDLSDTIDFRVNSVPQFGENFKDINRFVNKSISDGKTVVLCVSTSNINHFLDEIDSSYVLTDFNNVFPGKVNVIKEKLAEGFEYNNYVCLTDYELFGRKTIMHKNTRFKNSSKIRDLSKLEIGDYVVHSLHGIGIYNGIKSLKKAGVMGDYLEVLYAKGDKLYIPASKIELISKYNGKDGYVPNINSLSSTAWVKAKNRIREKIKLEAERLIRIQAERKLKKGFAFSKDTPLQEMFENDFEYDFTLDQYKATEEIKADMESIVPMDRILCGDVGYGKTEVAFRAMFKAISDSKQVLYLCPTTLLCRQQYTVALDRFKNYPVNIGILNRFESPSSIRKTLEKLKSGELDIVFSTHRGLSDDVSFYDLGLLVVDEEQRFGVIQKEKIKEMKSSVDVLTLTATPIPRTLQMAVLGIKNLSLIETPPKNRKSVVTYVTPFDKKLVREIVYKEVSRGGQVFILYNRVEDIETKVNMFKTLLPEVSINFAHGKMDKDSFEDVMNDFVENKFDVLVCTTIIETGIDIPNVNSLIIMDADRFGLSQLYQIRGRVGRSDAVAYAYLMYDSGRVLTEKAVKRLKVIKDFTELGSGFAIAAKDLSIRGAGDILGSDQAGFIDSVGIDLYLKMLDEEVNRLKGIEIPEDETETSNLNVSFHVKDSYVSDEDMKIEIHKIINSIDSFEKLKEVKSYIEDRFGPCDEEMVKYMNEQLFESLCSQVGISNIFDNNIYREVSIDEGKSDIDYEGLFVKALSINKKFVFSYKQGIIKIKLNYKDTKDVAMSFNLLFKELL